MLAVVTCRPEYADPWRDHENVASLALERLDRGEGERLVGRMTGDKALPTEVLDQVLAKADGNPLFVEELTKAVLDSGVIEDQGDGCALVGPIGLAIPTTLKDFLTARLDRLGPAKEAAQVGATIGRLFLYEMVALLSALGETELGPALVTLAGADLIQARGTPPKASYLFRHALLQDAAYDSMLKSKRQKLHGRIARLLEENYPETAETEPEVVARHYTAAGNAESAIGYWLAAGRRSLQRGANKEAIGHLGRGLECLATLPETPERQLQELTLQTALGPALLATKGWGAAEPNAVYQRARELCGRVGDTRQMFAALWGIWLFHTARGDVPAARNLIEELLALAEGEQDAELQLQAHHAAWGTICWLGEFGTALEHVEQGLAIYDPEKHRNHALRFGGHDPGVGGKGQGALTYGISDIRTGPPGALTRA